MTMCSLISLLIPVLYILLFSGIIIFLLALRKRTKEIYDRNTEQNKTIVERQKQILEHNKESVELLREIRDLLKNK